MPNHDASPPPAASTRRTWLVWTGATATLACAGGAPTAAAPARKETPPPQVVAPPAKREPAAPRTPEEAIAAIEARVGGRVGVFAMDTGGDRTLAHRADERFAMCSTFKWALAAAILERVDAGLLTLDLPIRYGQEHLLEYAPVTRERVNEGSMSVSALCEAAVTVSDNTAANLLLEVLGGPEALTAFFRRLGDGESRLDRVEPFLNNNELGDPLDTTTPRAMATALQTAILGDVLSHGQRARLITWMAGTQTGTDRLRAGIPAEWRTGTKTGTGSRGATNDLAVTWPPDALPLIITSYMSDSHASVDVLGPAHAELARIAVDTLRSSMDD